MASTPLDTALAALAGRRALLIAGPTASGKSALAIAVARAIGGVVINADSMQVYDGPRILTARPTLEEEACVTHALYGFVSPTTAFTAGDYMRAVSPLLDQLAREDKAAVIVGGTGLYFRALTAGLVEMPAIPPEIMAAVDEIATEPASLHAWLVQHDGEAAARLSPADLPRLQRAASVLLATGEALSAWQKRATTPVLAAGTWAGVFIHPDRDWLYRRIDGRFHAMMEQGALDEVRAVQALGLPANRGVMKAHGMPHLLRFLDGKIDRETAIRLGQQDTRNYAKRQMTWARRSMADWTWIDVPD